MMNRRYARHLLWTFWLWWTLVPPALAAPPSADDDPITRVTEAFRHEHEQICGFGSRFAGQPGMIETASYLEDQMRKAGITQQWRQPVELVLPVTETCVLAVNDEIPVDIHPVWPNGANLSTTPGGPITAQAVYVGTGELSELPVEEIAGRIAVMEFNSRSRWQYAAMYGAVAVIFLRPQETSWTQSDGKYTYVSVPLPRFYIHDPVLSQRLREEPNLQLTLHSRVHWQRRTCYNILGFIPGSHPEHRDKVAVLHARYDACSVVPDLAFGAEQAINPALVLQTARRLAARPPAYSVLVAFVCGDTFELTGSRRLMKTLSNTQTLLGRDVDKETADLDTLRNYRTALTSGDLLAVLTRWENRHLRNDHVLWQTRVRLVRILDELRHLRRVRSDQPRQDRLNNERIQLLELQQRLRHDQLGDTDVERLEALMPAIMERLDGMIADYERRLERGQVDLNLMQGIGLGRGTTGDYSRGILFCSFELSSHSRQFGPFAQSYMCEMLVQKQLLDYGTQLRNIAAELDLPPEIRDCYLDDTTEGRRHWQSDLPFPVVNGIDAAANAGCLGLMFATTQDMRQFIDTPLDTIERVDTGQLNPQIVMLGALLDEALGRPMKIVGSRMVCYYGGKSKGNRWEGMAAMATPGEGQLDLGVANAVIYARSYRGTTDFGVRGIGVRDMVVLMTDAEGKYAVNDLLNEQTRQAPLLPEVYVFDDDGKVLMAMNRAGPWEKPITGYDRKIDRLNLRGEMFECAQIGVFGLNDTRHLEDLDKLVVVEKARGTEPRAWFWVLDEGVASVCVPTDVERWQLVCARGNAKRRMLMINASADTPEGAGFPLDWRQTAPLPFVSAHDFACLNEHRISRLEDTGVVDSYLRQQHEQGQSEAREAADARAAGNAAAAWRHATQAMGIQAQVYAKTRAAADDTIHAVLFLLVCLVPFCYFVERLLLAATHIYWQIAGFSLLFVLMTALVGTFHPAFRISMTPVTILLAFLILFLSVLVIAIILGKFRSELQRLRKDQQETPPEKKGAGVFSATLPGTPTQPDSSAEDFKRFDVLHRAMLLGIANMRRRKVRTGLTLATLVLLSFVIMSFTNPQTHLHPLHYEVTDAAGIDPERSAVMIQRLSWGPMPTWTLDHLKTAYSQRATVAGHWWITLNDLKTQFPKKLKISGTNDKSALLSAIMCIEPVEARTLRLDRLTSEETLNAFTSADDALLISKTIADRIGVQAGDPVHMFGSTFIVAGVIDNPKLLSLTGFNGQTYAPIDYMRYARLDADPTKVQEKIDAAEEAEQAADLTSAATAEDFRTVSPDEFVIIRASRAAGLDATLRSVLLMPHDPKDTQALADELAGQIHRPVYANTDGRVILCAATEITGLTGLGNVVVPLFISALIIFNTMLNSVYERQREIGILMSVGLAPVHVGALFVAEAAAYGTLGVVGGYIIGQGLGTVASQYNLIPGIHLNFSSLAAVYTQLAIMVVVLLSSLWPAWKATKIAAPGSESTWRLPVPEGDIMNVALPFTMHTRDSKAVLAYLHEWLATHTESSLGRFCSGAIEMFAEPQTRGLVAQIWLAPFDLGIMQTVELEIRPGRDPSIHEVNISLRREAGPHSAWIRGNRLFLTDLRKQFLLWRSIPARRKDAYKNAAEPLFATA